MTAGFVFRKGRSPGSLRGKPGSGRQGLDDRGNGPFRSTTYLPVVGLALLLCTGSSAAADGEAAARYVIVTRQALAGAASGLADYRKAGGCEVRLGVVERIVPDGKGPFSPEPIKAWIDAQFVYEGGRPARPGFVVIVGDETESPEGDAPWRVPTFRKPLYRWRSKQRETFTSDMAYGDVDGDGLPDVPVGRLPVRAAEEVSRYVAKVRAYESQEGGEWDLRVVLWAGIPGYDARSDLMMTPVAMQAVNRYLPPSLSSWWLTADPQWPCWLPPAVQPRRFLDELSAGSVVGFYGGHGSETTLLANPHKDIRTVLRIADVKDWGSSRPTSPLMFLACTTGRFEWDKGPCLGEVMLDHPGGPVVVAAASTESHPLTNYYTSIALAKMMGRGFDRFGRWWVESQRLGFEEHSPLIESLLKDAEGKLEPEIDVSKLRRDQPLMYNILGDPACRLRLPRPLAVKAAVHDGQVRVETVLPEGVRRVSLAILRSRTSPAMRGRTTTAEADMDVLRKRLDAFNDATVSLGAEAASPGPVRLSRSLPSGLLSGGHSGAVRLAAFGEQGTVWVGTASIDTEIKEEGR